MYSFHRNGHALILVIQMPIAASATMTTIEVISGIGSWNGIACHVSLPKIGLICGLQAPGAEPATAELSVSVPQAGCSVGRSTRLPPEDYAAAELRAGGPWRLPGTGRARRCRRWSAS